MNRTECLFRYLWGLTVCLLKVLTKLEYILKNFYMSWVITIFTSTIHKRNAPGKVKFVWINVLVAFKCILPETTQPSQLCTNSVCSIPESLLVQDTYKGGIRIRWKHIYMYFSCLGILQNTDIPIMNTKFPSSECIRCHFVQGSAHIRQAWG